MKPIPDSLLAQRLEAGQSKIARLDGRPIAAAERARLSEKQAKQVRVEADPKVVARLVAAEAAFTATFKPEEDQS